METDTAEVDSPQTEEPNVADSSTEELREALGLTEPTSQEVAPEPGIAPPEEAASTGVEQVETPLEAESDADRLAKRRIRPRNELDQQVIDLYRSNAFQGTFADASRVIYNQEAQPEARQLPPQEAEAAQPDPYDAKVTDINAEISELEDKVKQAADDLETTEALTLQREVMRKELELQQLKSRREREQEAAQSEAIHYHREKAVGSRDRVYQRFPTLQDKGSIERKQFDEYVRVSSENPDYQPVFDSPLWPEIMASEFAIQMQASQAAQQQVAQAPQQQAPVMGSQARVLTTGGSAQPANTPLTQSGVAQELPNLSSDDLYKMLGAGGGSTPHR
jgi:hypothetical protein